MMKEKLLLEVILLCLLSIMLGCDSIKDKKVNEKIPISIDSLTNTWAKDPTELIDLWSNNPDFLYIYENPELYYIDIRNYLLDFKNKPAPDTNYIDHPIQYFEDNNIESRFLFYDIQYSVAILSMQELNIYNYLDLAYIGADLYYNKYISKDVFYCTLYGYKELCNIKKHLNNPKVIKFLKSIVDNPNTSKELSEIIKNIYLKETK